VKIDKISVVLLVWIGICSVFAFVVPIMAGIATQTASTGQAPTILLKAQDNTTMITGWTFSGDPGYTNATPMNNNSEIQVLNAPWKPVVLLNNSGPITYKIILRANQFSDAGVANVSDERYNVTNTTAAPADANAIDQSLIVNGDKDTGKTIAGKTGTNDGQMSLWLKLTLGYSANKTATASFSVLGET